MAKYTYRVEYFQGNDWEVMYLYRDVPKTWAEGWLAHHRDAPGPRLALRLVRSDGKVIDEVREKEDVSLGMVAGWPSWEQYVAASIRALDKAAQVSSRQSTMTPERRQEIQEASERLRSILNRKET